MVNVVRVIYSCLWLGQTLRELYSAFANYWLNLYQVPRNCIKRTINQFERGIAFRPRKSVQVLEHLIWTLIKLEMNYSQKSPW